MTKLYKTYIKGFDKELGGGIPEGHIVLIAGTPGTMKSSLSYYFLYHNVLKEGARGLYLSFEQSKKSLIFQVSRMNMKPDLGENLQIVDLSRIRTAAGDHKSKNWLKVVQKHLELLHNKFQFNLLVIDSLPVLEILSLIDEKRTKFFQFFEWLRKLNLTTLIINEVSPDPNLLRDEDFLADGIIHLTMERVGDIDIFRRIRCIKMRGMGHNTSIFTLEYKDNLFKTTQAI
jgi:KaiC/GvpD/RAD55 family RecA-like ATPase